MWRNRYNHKHTSIRNWNVALLTLALIVVVVMGSSCSSAAKTTPATTTKTTTTPVAASTTTASTTTASTVATTTTTTTSQPPTTAATTTTTTTSQPPTTAATTTTTTTSQPPTTAATTTVATTTTTTSPDKATHLTVDIELMKTTGFTRVWLKPLDDLGFIKIVQGTVDAKLWLIKNNTQELAHTWDKIILKEDNYTILSKGAEISLPFPDGKEYDYDEPGIFLVTLTLIDGTKLTAELRDISLHPTAEC
jgi:hypothetical protein